MAPRPKPGLKIIAFVSALILSLYCFSPAAILSLSRPRIQRVSPRTCYGKHIYIYDLPPEFNEKLVSGCKQHDDAKKRCAEMENWGLGTRLHAEKGTVLYNRTSWWDTSELSLELIFHKRLQDHKCRVLKPEYAQLFYIPYYPALDYDLHKSLGKKKVDELAVKLENWLPDQKMYQRHKGQDHFMVKSMTTWTYRREDDLGHMWGTRLEMLPNVHAMYKLEVERSEWGPEERSSAVPYPTGFHPVKDAEILAWQAIVRESKRKVNISFVDFKVNPQDEAVVDMVVQQCESARSCESIDCNSKACSADDIMDLNLRSVFSVQTRGKSFTTKNFFDALLSGSIPVVLWHETVGRQYRWHLPEDPNDFAVHIPQDELKWLKLEQVLHKIPAGTIKTMQKNIVALIPKILYAHPEHKLSKFRDAFDMALDSMAMEIGDLVGGW